jgi:hypothetical protein
MPSPRLSAAQHEQLYAIARAVEPIAMLHALTCFYDASHAVHAHKAHPIDATNARIARDACELGEGLLSEEQAENERRISDLLQRLRESVARTSTTDKAA